jgi:ATP-dependent exoDNAse (exonuclease V) alpha subunit
MAEQLFPDELQQRYEKILAQTRKLQKELGIKSRTLEERYQDYLARRAEEEKRLEDQRRLEEELKKLNFASRARLPIKRP